MKEDFESDLEPDEIIEDDGKQHRNTREGLLTEGQLKFAQEVAKGTRLNEAYTLAFPDSKGSKLVNNYASRLVRNPKVRQEIELLQHAARMQFIMDAPRAAQKMIELSENAKQERVQLEATKDILNRAGLQPPQRVETVAIGIFGSASSEDIRALLRNNLEKKEEDDKE